MMKAKNYMGMAKSSSNTKGVRGLEGRTPMDMDQRKNEMASAFDGHSARTAENKFGDPDSGYGHQYAPGLDSYMDMSGRGNKDLKQQSGSGSFGSIRSGLVEDINRYKHSRIGNK